MVNSRGLHTAEFISGLAELQDNDVQMDDLS